MSTPDQNIIPGRELLIHLAQTDIRDAERCNAMHITPATGTLLRRLRQVTIALENADTTLREDAEYIKQADATITALRAGGSIPPTETSTR